MKNKLGFWAKLSLLITTLQFVFMFLEKLHRYRKNRAQKKK
ncbi:hypothetical protein [Liquorilactobacillus uvarum]|nr:hypothetical protein [Liquorilactobacillus uvarum]